MTTRYEMPEGVLRAELDGELVLLNPESGVYHLLNPTGRRVMDSLDSGADLDGAVQDLATTSGVDPERARIDAEAFVRDLVERGLLAEVR
jgi:PqqD family protein of HPr-rel-A system